MPEPLLYAVAALAAVSLALSVAAVLALRQRRYVRMLLREALALVLLLAAGLLATLGVAVQGYRALTHEEVAARVRTTPLGPKEFRAQLTHADGRQAQYLLAGDEFYIDAHILKWKSVANVFGLHTAYELDRIGGRYRDIEEERRGQRTLHALAQEKPLNLFDLRRRYLWLAPLVDADYGSATFISVAEPAEFEVRVSTTGLLIRRVDAVPTP
jgi:hypothetical protein